MVTLLQVRTLAAAALDAENSSSYALADERAQDSAGESTYSDALYPPR